MSDQPAMLETVRRAVRRVVDQTPELMQKPELRRRIASNMVGVSLAAAELIDAERKFSEQVAERTKAKAPPAGEPLAAAQAAGDFHRRTAVNSAADVLQATRRALDFPNFVTSLITGVFQAMNTSTIQQLEAYANLLGAVNMSTSSFAASNITPGRAATWAAAQFPEFQITAGDPPTLALKEDAEMPTPQVLKSALEATNEEVSSIEEDDLETTLLPLVSRKLARERQSMLATMLLMGMNRIVVDQGRIHASMELQVDARSTAEQTQAERFDSRFTTSGSGSFGMGMWGASASMSASVGFVRSDEQFSREDIALRAGLRSSVDIGFHTEPLALNRIARGNQINSVRDRAMVPETERAVANPSLLTADERRTTRPQFEAIPNLPQERAPNSDEARAQRQQQDHTVTGVNSGSGNVGGQQGGQSGNTQPTETPAPAHAETPPPGGG